MARAVRKAGMKEATLSEIEHRLENDPRFLKRIEKARASIRAGRGVPLEEIDSE